jgi:hypothetical protein
MSLSSNRFAGAGIEDHGREQPIVSVMLVQNITVTCRVIQDNAAHPRAGI